ncbi:PepSY domain-containing protein [Actinomadura craniellae]|uniref:PepSY domain-containing protein n=2 Tax=Actinomadura craniellae TaxID=2231787 RepID=A0A365HDG8_9ACTN|nr:PepSY domain-containing protein [Actinomadura craniellae]
MIADRPSTAAAPAAARRRSAEPSLWPLVTRLHFYAALFVAPFLFLAALTGLAYAFAPQLDQIVYRDVLRVEQVTGDPRPMHQQIRAARAAHPEGRIASVVPPATPEETTRVVLEVAEPDERRRSVYVDPYTGEVTGALTTKLGGTPITTWLSEAHSNLHLGAPGRIYLELAASWLWLVVVAGLLMWLGRRRLYRGKAPFWRALWYDRSGRGVRRDRSRHATLGLWLSIGAVFLSLTGLSWSDHGGARFEAVERSLGAKAPALDTALPVPTGRKARPPGDDAATAGAADPARRVGPVLAAARAAGLSGPVEVGLPRVDGTAWTVTQTDNRWPVRKDQVAVDPATGKVTDRVDWADHPRSSRLRFLGSQVHRGPLFGPVNQAVLAVIALGLLVVIAWGYRMWWRRRPTGAERWTLGGRPPPRAAWRKLPVPVLVTGFPVLLVLLWAMPVLGLSLAGFLVADAVVGAVQRRRAADPAR